METGRDGKPWPILRLNENQGDCRPSRRPKGVNHEQVETWNPGQWVSGRNYSGRVENGYLDEYELVGIAGRSEEKTKALAEKSGCRPCADIDELLALKPDYIAEAASVAAVKGMAVKALSAGTSIIVLSIGAFADQDFYEEVKRTALKHGTKVHIASGAVGGFDVLRTVSLMGDAVSGIETRKGPKSLKNTPLFEDHFMTDTEETRVFTGQCKEAIALLPTKVNVAVAASLATTGPEQTKVTIHSIPGFVGDDHKITAEIPG